MGRHLFFSYACEALSRFCHAQCFFCFIAKFRSPYLSYVDLSECQLTVLPRNLPATVRYLQLRRNNITDLPRRSPILRRPGSLAVLILDENVIEQVEDGAFERLVNLDQLWLNGNRLTAIPRRLPVRLRRLLMDFNFVGNLTATDWFHSSTGVRHSVDMRDV